MFIPYFWDNSVETKLCIKYIKYKFYTINSCISNLKPIYSF